MRKQIRILSICLSVMLGLSACGGGAETETNNTANNADDFAIQQAEPTPSTKSTYYTDLIENDTKQKEEKELKREEDLQTATLMLGLCTQKLENCTVTLIENSTYKCSEAEKESINVNALEKPTDGNLEINSEYKFTDNAVQFNCVETQTLYRDKNAVSTIETELKAYTKAQDEWSDDMKFTVSYLVDNKESGIDQTLSKNDAYHYLAKDVRSALSKFLSIDLDNVREEDESIIITGTTKDMVIMADEVDGASLFTHSQLQLGAKAVDNTLSLLNRKCDVTITINKQTETLESIEAIAENNLNNETSILKCEISDIATTVIN